MTYPATPKNCFSVRRFLKAKEDGLLPREAWLGGRLENTNEREIFLSGQGEVVSIPIQQPMSEGIKPGDEICVSLRTGEVQLLVSASRKGLSRINPHLENWATFMSHVRQKLGELGLVEVQTPSLVQNPGMEAHLKSFETRWEFGSQSKPLYLPTSPELHLKQMLCQGWTDIFEIKNCFRSEELSEHHEPEFTMLEWYRAYADLDLVKEDLKKLIRSFDPCVEFEDLNVEELTPEKMVNEIEPKLPKNKAVFVTGYPATEAALARVNEDGQADRFELYWKGLELANAFHELNDPAEQRKRHQADQKYRQENSLQDYELDENFLEGLEAGMPPSGGIALGLDRLFMALYDVPSIQEMRSFSIKHQLRGEL